MEWRTSPTIWWWLFENPIPLTVVLGGCALVLLGVGLRLAQSRPMLLAAYFGLGAVLLTPLALLVETRDERVKRGTRTLIEALAPIGGQSRWEDAEPLLADDVGFYTGGSVRPVIGGAELVLENKDVLRRTLLRAYEYIDIDIKELQFWNERIAYLSRDEAALGLLVFAQLEGQEQLIPVSLVFYWRRQPDGAWKVSAVRLISLMAGSVSADQLNFTRD